MNLLIKILLVATGGATGSIIRYLLESHFKGNDGTITWLINTLGSFLMGLFFGLILTAGDESSKKTLVQTLLMSGFCGGFSTFAHFAMYTVNNINQGNANMAIIYTLVTIVAGLGCCAFGLWLGTRMIGA